MVIDEMKKKRQTVKLDVNKQHKHKLIEVIKIP